MSHGRKQWRGFSLRACAHGRRMGDTPYSSGSDIEHCIITWPQPNRTVRAMTTTPSNLKLPSNVYVRIPRPNSLFSSTFLRSTLRVHATPWYLHLVVCGSRSPSSCLANTDGHLPQPQIQATNAIINIVIEGGQ